MCSHKYLTIKPVYTTLCLYTKKYQRSSCVFSTKHYDSYLKKDPHVFSQILNYKTCLYNFVSLHKNTKDPPVFFHKTLRFISEKKILMCSHKYLTIKPVYTTLCLYTKNTKVFTKHYDSYPSNYKTCLYNFVSLHKNTKDPPVFFHKTLRFISEKKSSCVLTNT